jgi:hypothetical protein
MTARLVKVEEETNLKTKELVKLRNENGISID